MTTQALATNYDRPMRLAFIVGLVAAVVAVAGLFISGPGLFFQAYLYSFLFWLGISLGCLALLLLHFVVGSRWGLAVRRITEAASGSLWLMALLFIPLIIGLPFLYSWARPAEVAASPLLQYKSWYLNVPFFIIRAAVYFIIWLLYAYLGGRWAVQVSHTPPVNPLLRHRPQGLAALGLILYGLTMTFAAVDWMMSLSPEWTSTAFGAITFMGQVLTGMAFSVLVLNLVPNLSIGRTWNFRTTPVPYQDLGALLLTFVMGYTYIAFFQMLIQWAGNIPRETFWYYDRVVGGWSIVAYIIFFFQFALPFLALLSMRVRHSLKVLGWLGGMLLVAYLIDLFWQIKPAFSPAQFSVSWLDIVMPFAIGGIWLGVFLFNLKRRPALSPEDQEAIHVGEKVENAIP